MSQTPFQRIVNSQKKWLDKLSEQVQPKVQEAVSKGGRPVRNALDGVWMGSPLHPVLTDVPIGSLTAAVVFDGLEVVTGSKPLRNAADASLALGIAGGVAAAVVGISDWRYLSGGSRRMGMAHGLLNTAGLALSAASLGLRAAGKRNAGRMTLLAGYSLNGMGAHLGGELSYGYGLRVDRNVFEGAGPDGFTAVIEESDLPEDGLRRIEVDGVGVLLSRTGNGICAISATCNHFSGPLENGEREGDTVVCPWHGSRFDLCNGEVLDGPAIFPQSTYEVRLRDGNVEVKASEDNIQKQVR